MTTIQFVVNSVSVAFFMSHKTGKTFSQVWNDTCLNTLVIYVFNAIVAGVFVKAFMRIDAFMVLVSVVIFAIVFLTYRRYVNDIKETAAKAEQAERERAEQAENHVKELQHYVAELERSGHALRESREKFPPRGFSRRFNAICRTAICLSETLKISA